MASTIARMASTPALMEAPVVLALVNTSRRTDGAQVLRR